MIINQRGVQIVIDKDIIFLSVIQNMVGAASSNHDCKEFVDFQACNEDLDQDKHHDQALDESPLSYPCKEYLSLIGFMYSK